MCSSRDYNECSTSCWSSAITLNVINLPFLVVQNFEIGQNLAKWWTKVWWHFLVFFLCCPLMLHLLWSTVVLNCWLFLPCVLFRIYSYACFILARWGLRNFLVTSEIWLDFYGHSTSLLLCQQNSDRQAFETVLRCLRHSSVVWNQRGKANWSQKMVHAAAFPFCLEFTESGIMWIFSHCFCAALCRRFVVNIEDIAFSGVLLKMEVGIRKQAWQRAWRYPAYLWSLRWVYAVKKTPEVGIRCIPAYTPQYTTDCIQCFETRDLHGNFPAVFLRVFAGKLREME